VLGDVLEVEALRKLEVDLDRGVGELATVSVENLEVDLRAVERGLPHSDPVRLAHRLEGLAEVGLRFQPLLLAAEPLLLHVVPGRESVVELVDAENLREVEGEVDGPLHLVHQLLWSAEDVRVVERKHADAIDRKSTR